MATNAQAIRILPTSLVLALLAGAVGCSSAPTARDDYYLARALASDARPGDGTLVSIGPGSPESATAPRLTAIPLAAPGDLAAVQP